MLNIYSLLYGNVEITVKAIYGDNQPIKIGLEGVLNGRKIVINNHFGSRVVPQGKYDYPTCAYNAYRVLACEYNKRFQQTLDNLIHPYYKKPSDYKVACYFMSDLVKTFDSIQDAATQLRLSPSDIRRICEIQDRTRKTCGGYVWRYVTDKGDIIRPWLILDDYKGNETYFRGIPTRLDEREIPQQIKTDMLKDKELRETLSDQGLYAKDERERRVILKKEREENDIREFVRSLASNGKQLKCVYQTAVEELYHGLDCDGVLMVRVNYTNKSIDVKFVVYDASDKYAYGAKMDSVRSRFKNQFGDFFKWHIN